MPAHDARAIVDFINARVTVAPDGGKDEAYLRLVAMFADALDGPAADLAWDALQCLAFPHNTHPDYRPEWRPSFLAERDIGASADHDH